MDAKKEPVIYLVDDDEEIRKRLRAELEDEFKCYVKCYENGAACLEALQSPQRDCSFLITDVRMPYMDGLTLLKEVKQLRPWLSVLVFTACGNVPLAVNALKSGALDFIEKPFASQVLFPLVSSALDRSLKADEIAGKPLSPSEKEILKLIAEGKSNYQMSALQHRSVRTIERHRYTLMHKLNVTSPAELTKAAIALGLTTPEIR
ncbi:MAG: response regulator [Phycisphaerales bacterium]